MTTLQSRCYDGTVIQSKQGRAATIVTHDGVLAARIPNGKSTLAGIHRAAVRLYLSDTGQARLA